MDSDEDKTDGLDEPSKNSLKNHNYASENVDEAEKIYVETYEEKYSSHSGWLPPPSTMREYENLLPGLAERIVLMPEREQNHRHETVSTHIKRNYDVKERGQKYALVSMMTIILFSAYLAYLGEIAWAGRVAIGTLAAVVGIFITGKWLENKSTENIKDEDLNN